MDCAAVVSEYSFCRFSLRYCRKRRKTIRRRRGLLVRGSGQSGVIRHRARSAAGRSGPCVGGVLGCSGASGDKQSLPLPSAPEGALLAKLQAEATPVLAMPDAELPAVITSHL